MQRHASCLSGTERTLRLLRRLGLSLTIAWPSQMRATLPLSVNFVLIFWSSLNLSCLIFILALYAALLAFIRLRYVVQQL